MTPHHNASAPDLPINQILQRDCIPFMQSLPSGCMDLIFADPPYNLQLDQDLWRPNMTAVDAVTDEWDQFESLAEYDASTRSWLIEARRLLSDTGTLWVIGSYHNIYRVGAILMDLGYWILNDVVWIKHNPMPHMKGVRLCNAHETLIWAKKSKQQARYTFNYKALKAGNEDKQLRSDWYFPICAGMEREVEDGRKAHATQKPEALLYRIIAACTRPGDLVFDPFCGTGTTPAVAKKLGRRYIATDREEKYVALAQKRVEMIAEPLVVSDAFNLDTRKPRVSFLSLVECGKLHAGDTLWLLGTARTAEVQADGSIIAEGFRGSIHKVGAHCLNLPACNGWETWRYGSERNFIDELRRLDLSPQPTLG